MTVVFLLTSGVAALLAADRTVYAVLLWAGTGYLLLTAWGARRGAGAGFALARFVGPRDPVDAALAAGALGAVFVGTTFTVFSAHGVLAALARPALLRRPRALGRAGRGSALGYLLLAVGLAVEQLR